MPIAAAEAMQIGDPKDDSTQFGPLASEEHWTKVSGYLGGIEADGGKVLTGGHGEGWFVRPTIVVDAPAVRSSRASGASASAASADAVAPIQ